MGDDDDGAEGDLGSYLKQTAWGHASPGSSFSLRRGRSLLAEDSGPQPRRRCEWEVQSQDEGREKDGGAGGLEREEGDREMLGGERAKQALPFMKPRLKGKGRPAQKPLEGDQLSGLPRSVLTSALNIPSSSVPAGRVGHLHHHPPPHPYTPQPPPPDRPPGT